MTNYQEKLFYQNAHQDLEQDAQESCVAIPGGI